MKLLHLSDLHLGKKVNDISMLTNQEYVLNQALELVSKEDIQTVLIAGDIFDKPVANIEAIRLFNNFLKSLNAQNKEVLIISGNHDNIDRLTYLSDLVSPNIVFAKNFENEVQKVELSEDTDIYLLPYLTTAQVKKYNSNDKKSSYQEGFKQIIDDIELDKNKVNILVAHQFVINSNAEAILSDSEEKSVGTIDSINCEIFKDFGYVALGHLHCAQKVADNAYYSGSILKYSLSEINQKKKFNVVEIKDKKVSTKFFDIQFLNDIKEYKGYFEEFIDPEFYKKINTNDFIHFVLYDENLLDAKKELSRIYPNIIMLEFDNSFTKNLSQNFNFKLNKNKNIEEHFEDFYKMQIDKDLTKSEKEIVKDVLNATR